MRDAVAGRLGETRQPATAVAADDDRSMLYPQRAARRLQVEREAPRPALATFVERYWTVSWSLPAGVAHEQATAAYPCVDLVFEPGQARVHGVKTRSYRRRFSGEGQAFGVKFRPGGFAPFLARPVATLIDQAPALDEVFGPAGAQLAADVRGAELTCDKIAIVEAFLMQRLPAEDPNIERISRLIAMVRERPAVTCRGLADAGEMSVRQLQRIFRAYVGVSPKWVIARMRLLEALRRASSATSWAQLAADLGYFDQAHCTNAFRGLVGLPVGRYAQACRADAA